MQRFKIIVEDVGKAEEALNELAKSNRVEVKDMCYSTTGKLTIVVVLDPEE